MPEQELCCGANCNEVATVRCGTWSFCAECAILVNVVLDEDGRGNGNYGTAYAFGPDKEKTIAAIRAEQVALPPGKPVFYQPRAMALMREIMEKKREEKE